MAKLRTLKKDIDYLVNEVAYDCYLALYFNPDKYSEIVAIMEEAVDLRNNLFEMANNPADKHNKSLVRKHYAFVHQQMFEKIDGLFVKLSEATKIAK